jgi:aquaporin Z
MDSLTHRPLLAEAFGTFWLVFGGCGSAVLAAGEPGVGIGWLGVALAFGLSVLTMAYAVGPISGGHFNPAVSVGLAAAGRFPWRAVAPYAAAQVAGAAAAGLALYLVVAGHAGEAGVGGFASNGYGEFSPGGFGMGPVALTEALLTLFFLLVILGATAPGAPAGFAPIAIGLALTLIHLVSIPVSNTSVNPARSTGVALFAETGAVGQLWLFWLAPLAGGLLGGIAWRTLFARATLPQGPAPTMPPGAEPS